MGWIRTIGKALGLVSAHAEAVVDDARAKSAFEMSAKGIADATEELQKHKEGLGMFDGHIVSLTAEVDRDVDEIAALTEQANEYAALIELGGDGVDDAKQALAAVLAEKTELEAELGRDNAALDEAKAEYDEVLGRVREIQTFIEQADKDLDSDEAKFEMAKARRMASQLGAKIGAPGSAISQLKEATENRKTLINQAIGMARTERRLSEDPQAALKKRVADRIAAQKGSAAVDAFMQARKDKAATTAAG